VADGEADWLRVRERGVEIRVRLSPRSSREGVHGLHGDRLKIRLTAPPVGRAANEALIRFIARRARVPARAVRIVAGARSRSKTLMVECAEPPRLATELRSALGPAAAGGESAGRRN